MVHSQTNRPRALPAVAGQNMTVEAIAASSRWDILAACGDEDPELFFPVGTRGPAEQQEAKAKAVCARCPVRAPCLQRALEVGDDYSVRAGMTGAERRDLVRTAKKSAAEKSAQKTQTRQSA